MNRNLLQTLTGTVLVFMTSLVWAQNPRPCIDTAPPSICVLKSPYPFQAGAERTYDEMYHGPWTAQVEIALYEKPRGRQVVGKIKAGAVEIHGEKVRDLILPDPPAVLVIQVGKNWRKVQL